jgi:hypothetical protein
MSGFSSGSYGYDEFATEFTYEDEQNYTKPVKQPSFQDRVNAKRNSLNGNVNRLSKQSSRISQEECDCPECAPPKKIEKQNKPELDKSDKSEKPEKQDVIKPDFYIAFNKDTIFMLFIIILCVLSIVMYFKIKKLSHRLKQLTAPAKQV